jgi:exopolysaccharide production protein ExoQ
MSSAAALPNIDDPRPVAWPFWALVLIVGGVFFFVSHDWTVSLYDDFAPWSNGSDVRASGENVAKGAALLLLGILGGIFLFRGERPWKVDRPLAVAIFAFLAWAAISVVWSNSPERSIRALAVVAFCAAAALGAVRRFDGREIVLAAFIITTAYLVLGIAAELAQGTFRPWQSSYRFGGTVHPNTQGAHLSILCLAAVQLVRTETDLARRRWYIFVGLVAFAFLVLTRSRTSLAGFLAGLTALAAIRAKASTVVLLICSGFGASAAAALACSFSGMDVEQQLVSAAMLGRDGESEAFTGRLPVWEELWHYASARRWQGYGYNAFWTPDRIEDVSEDLHWRFREAHNAYLDTTLSIGLIGVAAMLAAVAIGIARTAKAYRRGGDPLAGFTAAMLVFGLFSALLESGMSGANFITLTTSCGLMQAAFFRRAPGPPTNSSCRSK